VLLAEPDILLLDEPTKGIDASFKRVFGQILTELAARGAAIIMVSHDAEFCARYAGRCALMFDGMIAAEEPPRRFFAGNYFYTTSASRMARALLPEAVTPEDVIRACGGDAAEEKECDECSAGPEPPPPAELPPSGGLSPVRRALVWLFAAASVLFFVFVLRRTDFAALLKNGGVSLSGLSGGWAYAGLIASLAGLSLAAGRGDEAPAAVCRRPGRATIVTAAVCAVLLPLTVLAGVYLFGDRKYLFISLLVLLEASVPFAADFERRGARTRELVVTAVLCALAWPGGRRSSCCRASSPCWPWSSYPARPSAEKRASSWARLPCSSPTSCSGRARGRRGRCSPWVWRASPRGSYTAGGRLRPGRTSLCVFGALAALIL
jgi:energy-coupling factor transport system ATP-binding protein